MAGKVNVGTIVATLVADAGRFTGGLKTAQSALGSFTGFVGDAARIAAGAGAAMLGIQAGAAGFRAVGDAAIGMNARLEESELQFETLLGSADKAKAHVAGLFEFAAKTPFETGPIIDASKMLLTFGGEALASKKNLDLVGNAAAIVGKERLPEVAFWFGRAASAIQGGRPFGEAGQNLQQLGVLTAGARDKMEQMQKSGASASEIFGVLTEDFGRFNGAMGKLAGTWGGLTATISDSVQMVAATAFKPLFDALKQGQTVIAEFVQSREFEAWGTSVAGVISRVIERVKSFLGSFSLSSVSTFLTNARDRFYETRDAAVAFFAPLTNAASALLPQVLGVLQQLGPVALGFATALRDAGIAASAQLAPTVASLATTVLPPLLTTFSSLLTVMQGSPETIYALAGAFAAWKIASLGMTFAPLLTALGNIITFAAPIVATMALVAGAFVAGGIAGQVLVDNWSIFFARGQQLAIVFAVQFMATMSKLLADLVPIFEHIPIFGKGIADGFRVAVSAANAGSVAMEARFNALQETASKPFVGLGQSASNFFEGLKGFAAGALPVVQGAFETMKTVGAGALEGVQASLAGIAGPAKSAGEGVAKATEAMTPKLEAVRDAAGNIRIVMTGEQEAFDKVSSLQDMVKGFNDLNPKMQLDTGDVERRLVSVQGGAEEVAKAIEGMKPTMAVAGDVAGVHAAVASLPEPIATRTIVLQAQTSGSPTMPFSEYWQSYAPQVLTTFGHEIGGTAIKLATDISKLLNEGISGGSIAQAQELLAGVRGVSNRFGSATKDLRMRITTATGHGASEMFGKSQSFDYQLRGLGDRLEHAISQLRDPLGRLVEEQRDETEATRSLGRAISSASFGGGVARVSSSALTTATGYRGMMPWR